MSKATSLNSRLDKLTENAGLVAEFAVGNTIMTIPKTEIITALRDLDEGRNTLHAGIIRNATASRGFGKMLLLREMLDEE
jgi:hypothetical protein